MACGRDPSAEVQPERRAWGAQRRGLQLRVPGGEGPESVCLCVHPTAALRGQLHPGLCVQVREVRAHTKGGFGVTLLTGGVAVPPQGQRNKQDPSCLLREDSIGAAKGTLTPETLGLQIPSKGLIAHRPCRVSFLPFSQQASSPCSVPSTLHADQRLGAGLLGPAERGALTRLSLIPGLSASQHCPVWQWFPQSRCQSGCWLLEGSRSSQATQVPFPSPRAPPPDSPPCTLSAASGQPALQQESPDPAPGVLTSLRRLLVCDLIPGEAVFLDDQWSFSF